MLTRMRPLAMAGLLWLPHAAAAEPVTGPASDLAERFAAACMADPSPYKSANDAANLGKLEQNKGLTGVDTPNAGHVVTTQTWHAGNIAGAELSLVSTNVDSGKCRVQACGIVAERFPLAGVEAALTKRLKLPAPVSREDSTSSLQSAWPLTAPPGQVVTLMAQKSLSGALVTLSVAQLCPRS